MLIRLFLPFVILLLVHLHQKLIGIMLARLIIDLRQAARGDNRRTHYSTPNQPKVAICTVLLPRQRGPLFRCVHSGLTLSTGALSSDLRVIRGRPRRFNRCRALPIMVLILMVLMVDGLEEPATSSLFAGDFGWARVLVLEEGDLPMEGHVASGRVAAGASCCARLDGGLAADDALSGQ